MEETVADVIDLKVYRELLRIGLYMEWRQTLDNDLPYEFIVTPEVTLLGDETEAFDEQDADYLRKFFEIGMDTFYFTK